MLSKIYPQTKLSEKNSDKMRSENPSISVDFFKKLDLSPNQSKIFRYLNKNGVRTASQLSEKLDIPRTAIYNLLKILQEKGCIVSKNFRPLKFKATTIEEFLDIRIGIEKKKLQELKEFLIMVKSKNEMKIKKIPPPVEIQTKHL